MRLNGKDPITMEAAIEKSAKKSDIQKLLDDSDIPSDVYFYTDGKDRATVCLGDWHDKDVSDIAIQFGRSNWEQWEDPDDTEIGRPAWATTTLSKSREKRATVERIAELADIVLWKRASLAPRDLRYWDEVNEAVAKKISSLTPEEQTQAATGRVTVIGSCGHPIRQGDNGVTLEIGKECFTCLKADTPLLKAGSRLELFGGVELDKSAVVKQDAETGKWILWTRDGKRKLGTHDSLEAAYRQEYAIQKSQEKALTKGAAIAAHLRRARNITHTDPTPAQAAAGNYANASLAKSGCDHFRAGLPEHIQRQIGLHLIHKPAAQYQVIGGIGGRRVQTVRADDIQVGAVDSAQSSLVSGARGSHEFHRLPSVKTAAFLPFPYCDQVAYSNAASPALLSGSLSNVAQDGYQASLQSLRTGCSVRRFLSKTAGLASTRVGDSIGIQQASVLFEKKQRKVFFARRADSGSPTQIFKRASSSGGEGFGACGPLRDLLGYVRSQPYLHRLRASSVFYEVPPFLEIKSAARKPAPLLESCVAPVLPAARQVDGLMDHTQAFSKLARLRRFHYAERNPSPAQVQAQNYKKGHISLHGLDITIENEKGSVRRGIDTRGKAWESKMVAPYGYIRSVAGGKSGQRARPKAVDGDAIDCFIGPDPESELVVAIDQYRGNTFDETKFVLGVRSQDEGEKLYLAHYPKGWRLGPVSTTTVQQLREWLRDGKHTAPFKGQMVKTAALGWIW